MGGKRRKPVSEEDNFFIKEKLNVWQLPDAHDINWYRNYLLLVKFYQEHGHTRVIASNAPTKSFRTWVTNQRTTNFQRVMPDWRKDLLRRINFELRINPPTKIYGWEFWYKLLLDYYNIHGHVDVPRKYCVNGYKLGAWVGLQRQKRKKLSKEQLERLEHLSFNWRINPPRQKYSFSNMIELLEQYLNKEGSIKWVKLQKQNKYLYQWLVNKRQQRDKVPLHEIKILESYGFPFITRTPELEWMERFEQYKKYVQKEGKARMTSDERIIMRNWERRQRAFYKKGLLNEEQIRLLDSINFVYAVFSWDINIKKLKKFISSGLNPKYLKDKSFNNWFTRTRRMKDELPEERRKELEALNFPWEPLKENLQWRAQTTGELWNNRYKELQAFFETNKHIKVPSKSELGRFIDKQKEYFRRGRLLPERQEKLEKLGVVFKKQEKTY